MNPASVVDDAPPIEVVPATRRNRRRTQHHRHGDALSRNLHSTATLSSSAGGEDTTATTLGGSGSSSQRGRSSPSASSAHSQSADTTATGCQKRLIDLYDPDLTVVYINTLVSSLVYVPSHDRRERTQHPPFVLCREFLRDGSCPRRGDCNFVHGAVGNEPSAPPRAIHANFTYIALENTQYPRLPAGETLCVMAPNGRPPGTQFPSEMVFVTQGSLLRSDESRVASRKPLSHCAHYYFNRVCNRGANCSFIHVVCLWGPETSDDVVPLGEEGGSVLDALSPPPSTSRQQPAAGPPIKALQAATIAPSGSGGGGSSSSSSRGGSMRQHNVGDVPVIKISRASPIHKNHQGGVVYMDPASPQFSFPQNPPQLQQLVAPVNDERSPNMFLHGSITSPATSQSESTAFLDGAPPSLHGSFATNSNATPTLAVGDDEQLLRGLTPGSSRPATPHRSDSFRSASSQQPPRSPSFRSVTVGSKTLLFAPAAQPKDKDGSSPAASLEAGSEGGAAVTTPLSFRHNPYGTPSSRNATPT